MSQYTVSAKQILKEAITIQQIAAPTFCEQERSTYVCQKFKEVGLQQVRTDRLNNVYGRIPGGDHNPIVVSAHMDTVFGQETDLTVQQDEIRIYGPGIGDNSLAVATLVGLKELVASFAEKPAGDIILVANVCEEGLGDLSGIKEVVNILAPEQPSAYLVLEGMGLDRIYVQGVGAKRYKITATAPGGHSWNDFGQGSAIHTLVRIAAKLTDLDVPVEPKTTYNIGMIQGGRSVNTIADTASMLLDLRSAGKDNLAQLVDKVEALFNSFSSEKTTIDYEVIGSRPSGAISVESDLVRLCQEAHVLHGRTDVQLKAGSTDANIPFSLDIPAVCLGLTQGKYAHLEKEYIEIVPFVEGLSILGHILQNIWEMKSD
ncbi:MAG: M20/M25/M40 family metallo-hydrolase [Desulfotalea sp.]